MRDKTSVSATSGKQLVVRHHDNWQALGAKGKRHH